jgi:hypothetical protein
MISANSLLKVYLHFSMEGSSLLKTQGFLSFHMDQHMRIMMSIANGTPKALFMCLVTLSGLSHEGTTTPIICQQFLAKEHLKSRCLRVSSRYNMQSSQLYESKCILFLLRSPLVFNLF